MSAIGPRKSTLGSMAARMAPPLLVPAKPLEAAPLRDRLTQALRAFPRTTSGLASELGDKELYVSQTLQNMAYEGLVIAGDVPPTGLRDRLWRLA
jgi:hypothetical protein